jgi:23S rRNA (guanosine2251-2'-O)-methyltransferase
MYREKKKENESGLTFGTHPVIEAIRSGKEIEKILIQQGLRSENYHELMQLVKEKKIPFQFVPAEKLNRVTARNHQGIIAFVSPVEFQHAEDIVPMLYEMGKQPLLLILDRVTDVRNFGAIVRTAECAGVDAIIIPARGSAQINADAVKTSAGALFRVPVCRSHNLKSTIDFLKDSGIKIIACTEKARENYFTPDFTEPVAVMMGSEEDGISGEYLKKADQSVLIPMKGDIASLNVSVAAGIILFEAARQRLRD